jgi:hypothetical protein
MSVASNGLAFVRITLDQDFQMTDIAERANLTRMIIQLFPGLNPHLNGGPNSASSSVAEIILQDGPAAAVAVDEGGLPAYEEVTSLQQQNQFH